jgi:hypothetical protein
MAADAPAPPVPVTPVCPASSNQAPAVCTESLYGIIPAVSRKKGLASVEAFNIMVTQRRMIFALMTNDMITQAAKQAGKEGGFFGGMLNAAAIGYTFYKRYLTMAPDAALVENPQNFAVELARIRKVKIEAGKEIVNYASIKANQDSILQQHRYENGKLEIETEGEKYNFAVPGSSLDMAMETLRKARLC